METLLETSLDGSFLRVSVEMSGVESDEFEWRHLKEQKSLRTLILSGKFKILPCDSFTSFSSLRTLYIECANIAALVESVGQLKHLRYLALKNCSDLSTLPANIHKMKFLQCIYLDGCECLLKLPDSIVKLRELRILALDHTIVNSIPRGFGALTNLRMLSGFPTYMEGSWCSLEELGPLSQIKELGLKGLESVSDTTSIAKAKIGAKAHLNVLALECSSKLGEDGLLKGGMSEEQNKIIEVVFDVLCPLPCLEVLLVKGYFGRQLPRWMMWSATVPLVNLRTLVMNDLACCTELPNGLCRLPCLEFLQFYRAPAIKRVGTEFVKPHRHRHHASSQAVAAFPRLHKMVLSVMVEWEEWQWEEEVKAMPALDELFIRGCKFRCLPPGLAVHARSLKKLALCNVKGLQSVENFASVVELKLYNIPYLTSISNFPKLQKLEIKGCPKLESLQEMSALRRLVLSVFYNEEQLPLYLQTVKPSHLQLDCKLALLASMAEGKSGSEWDHFSHIERVEGYSNTEDIEKRWHVFYTREPYNMETNIDLQSLKMYCVGYEGRSEEEWMCHDPSIKRTEEELAWIQEHA